MILYVNAKRFYLFIYLFFKNYTLTVSAVGFVFVVKVPAMSDCEDQDAHV